MNYVLTWLSGGDGYFPIEKHYYMSHERNCVAGSETIANATMFSNIEKAESTAYLLNARHFLGAMKVEAYTDKELFEALLKGI